jgi:arylsulfatase A-like enzyme
MDDAIGEVLDILKELGIDENTIVIFTSDNGGVVAGDASATTNKPLRAGKGYQFEGGIREPYFIKVPWLDQKGDSCSTPVTGADFYPTILELAGIPLRPEEHIDGLSLLPLLEGKKITERSLIWHYPHYGNQGGEPSSIIRIGDWKLIHYYEDGRKELYNLAQDLSETMDVSGKFPDKVKDLDDELFSYLNNVGAHYPANDPLYDPEKEAEHLEKIKNQLMPTLEKRRKDVLSKTFDPDFRNR